MGRGKVLFGEILNVWAHKSTSWPTPLLPATLASALVRIMGGWQQEVSLARRILGSGQCFYDNIFQPKLVFALVWSHRLWALGLY